MVNHIKSFFQIDENKAIIYITDQLLVASNNAVTVQGRWFKAKVERKADIHSYIV